MQSSRIYKMIEYAGGDIIRSPALAAVCLVGTAGAMGKGLALEFSIYGEEPL